jgi:hypothetical protein
MWVTYKITENKTITLPEADTCVFSCANDLLDKRITCMILFVGRKVTRFPLKEDRALLQEYGFELTFVNHLYLTNILNNVFFSEGRDYFEDVYYGYTLMAFSNQTMTKEILLTLLMLPYKNIIPFALVAHQTFYNKQRLLNHSLQDQQMTPVVLGVSPIFLFIIVLHNFLCTKIQKV